MNVRRAFVLASVLRVAPVLAEGESAGKPPLPWAFSLDGELGGGSRTAGEHTWATFPHLGLTALGSKGPFTVGTILAWEPNPLGVQDHLQFGGLAGFTLGARDGLAFRDGRFRLDVLGEFGAHYVHVADPPNPFAPSSAKDFGTSAKAVFPYAGFRTSPALVFERSGGRPFIFGVWVGANWAFGSKTLSYQKRGCGEYLDYACPDAATATVGGSAVDVGFRFGGEID